MTEWKNRPKEFNYLHLAAAVSMYIGFKLWLKARDNFMNVLVFVLLYTLVLLGFMTGCASGPQAQGYSTPNSDALYSQIQVNNIPPQTFNNPTNR
jgi:hypothetical protein